MGRSLIQVFSIFPLLLLCDYPHTAVYEKNNNCWHGLLALFQISMPGCYIYSYVRYIGKWMDVCNDLNRTYTAMPERRKINGDEDYDDGGGNHDDDESKTQQ